MAPACHNKEGATLHLGSCKYSLQYYGWLDWRLWLRVGTWNLGSLSGRVVEVCEELRKRMIDVCCLKGVRWREQGARMMCTNGWRYKLWCSGNGVEVSGVGIMVKEELCEKVVEVRRLSNIVMAIVVFKRMC